MLGFLGFGDALARLLARAYGERAIVTVYTEPDGEIWPFYLGPPERRDLGLANEQYRTALGTLLASFRVGDNAAYGKDFYGRPRRLQISFWHIPPYSDVPPPDELTLLGKDEEGQPILIDEDRFEKWLSNLPEGLSAKAPAAAAQHETKRQNKGGRPTLITKKKLSMRL